MGPIISLSPLEKPFGIDLEVFLEKRDLEDLDKIFRGLLPGDT